LACLLTLKAKVARAGPTREASVPLELSRSISRRLSGSAPEPVRHVHRAATFFARSSPFRGSDEEDERQRLGGMLASYGLCERLVKGDGNCQVRCGDGGYGATCVPGACQCLMGRVPAEQNTMAPRRGFHALRACQPSLNLLNRAVGWGRSSERCRTSFMGRASTMQRCGNLLWSSSLPARSGPPCLGNVRVCRGMLAVSPYLSVHLCNGPLLLPAARSWTPA